MNKVTLLIAKKIGEEPINYYLCYSMIYGTIPALIGATIIFVKNKKRFLKK